MPSEIRGDEEPSVYGLPAVISGMPDITIHFIDGAIRKRSTSVSEWESIYPGAQHQSNMIATAFVLATAIIIGFGSICALSYFHNR